MTIDDLLRGAADDALASARHLDPVAGIGRLRTVRSQRRAAIAGGSILVAAAVVLSWLAVGTDPLRVQDAPPRPITTSSSVPTAPDVGRPDSPNGHAESFAQMREYDFELGWVLSQPGRIHEMPDHRYCSQLLVGRPPAAFAPALPRHGTTPVETQTTVAEIAVSVHVLCPQFVGQLVAYLPAPDAKEVTLMNVRALLTGHGP